MSTEACLAAAVHDGRREGHAEQWLDQIGRFGIVAAQLAHGGARPAWVFEPRAQIGVGHEAVDVAGRDSGHARRGFVVGERRDHPTETLDGVEVVQRHRTVAATPVDRQAKLSESLLADRERIEPHAVDERIRAAALVEQVVAAHELGVPCDEPASAAVVAALLVGGGDEQEFSGKRGAGAGEARHGDGLGGHLVLHVGGAATPYVAVTHRSGERWDGPFAGLGRHDVEVPEKAQPRAGAGARQAHDEVLAIGKVADELRVEVVAPEVLGQYKGGASLVAGRISGVGLQQT